MASTTAQHRTSAEVTAEARWLAVVRILYCGLLLTVWRPPELAPLGELPDAWFLAPVGPFALLGGWPPPALLDVIWGATIALLAVVGLGIRTRTTSPLLTLALIGGAGLRYSTGKVGHDLVILVLPALLATSWGSALALRPEPSHPPRRAELAGALAATYAMAAAAKILSGWLSPAESSTKAWVETYDAVYGWTGDLAPRMLGAPSLLWEALDLATVLGELSIAVLVVHPTSRRLGVAAACVFHLGVLAIMGIDFSQLCLVYVALLPAPASPRRIRSTTAVIGVAVSLVVALEAIEVPSTEIGPGILLAATAWVAIGSSSSTAAEPRHRAAAVAGLLVCTFPLVVVDAEPYPAFTGPMFWGDGLDLVHEWRRVADDHVVDVREVFGVDNPPARNIGFALFRPPGQRGHEIGLLWYHPEPVVPDGYRLTFVDRRTGARFPVDD